MRVLRSTVKNEVGTKVLLREHCLFLHALHLLRAYDIFLQHDSEIDESLPA